LVVTDEGEICFGRLIGSGLVRIVINAFWLKGGFG